VNDDIETFVLAVELVPLSGRFFVSPDTDAPATEHLETVHSDWVGHIVRHPSGSFFACLRVPAEMPENSRELFWD
jgi:hypothetical protein